MIGKLLEMWSDATFIDIAALDHTEVTARTGREDIDRLKQAIFSASPGAPDVPPGEEPPPDDAPLSKRSRSVAAVEAKVRRQLEEEFTSRSDDGLLEHLERLGGDGADARHQAIATLASGVLNRRLFKLIGRAEGRADAALAQEKYDKFGSVDQRRELERAAARRAELRHGWKIVIWLPNPDMRLKVAEVLVDNDEGVAPLDRLSDAGGHIVAQHRKLWAISVYADAQIRDDQSLQMRRMADVLLSSLRTDMDIRLVRPNGTPVPTLIELSVDGIAQICPLEPAQREELLQLEPAALGGSFTFRELIRSHWRLAYEHHIVEDATPPGDLW